MRTGLHPKMDLWNGTSVSLSKDCAHLEFSQLSFDVSALETRSSDLRLCESSRVAC